MKGKEKLKLFNTIKFKVSYQLDRYTEYFYKITKKLNAKAHVVRFDT